MNLLYIHGWGSRFDVNSDKIAELSKVYKVFGINIKYTDPLAKIQENLYDAMVSFEVDFLVGTSMGGYLAHMMGNRNSIPYVMINPVIDPAITLLKYVGSGLDHYGSPYELTEAQCKTFPAISESNFSGLLLLDMDDDVIDANKTAQIFLNSEQVQTYTWKHGSHRFDHMKEAVPIIQEFESAWMSYGFGDN